MERSPFYRRAMRVADLGVHVSRLLHITRRWSGPRVGIFVCVERRASRPPAAAQRLTLSRDESVACQLPFLAVRRMMTHPFLRRVLYILAALHSIPGHQEQAGQGDVPRVGTIIHAPLRLVPAWISSATDRLAVTQLTSWEVAMFGWDWAAR